LQELSAIFNKMVLSIKKDSTGQDSSSFWNALRNTIDSSSSEQSILSDIKESFVRPIRRRASMLSIDPDIPEFLRQASQTLITGARTERRRSGAMPRSCSETSKLSKGGSRPRSNTVSSTHSELRRRLLSASSRRSTLTSLSGSLVSCSIVEHTCPCNMCSVNSRRQNFLENPGKLFVFAEYLKEEKKLEVVLSQYGNVQIQGHDKKKKPDVNIQIKIKFADGHTKTTVKKLESCRSTEDFKMNYHSRFECESGDAARAARLEVTVLYKKAFYRQRKVMNRLSMSLDDIETHSEEYLLYWTLTIHIIHLHIGIKGALIQLTVVVGFVYCFIINKCCKLTTVLISDTLHVYAFVSKLKCWISQLTYEKTCMFICVKECLLCYIYFYVLCSCTADNKIWNGYNINICFLSSFKFTFVMSSGKRGILTSK